MFSSAAPEFSAQGGAGGTPWGPGAASAESCTHPAKRDRCFPPPIAERQRLPNVGIIYVYFRIASLGQSQSHESQVASEATLMDTDKCICTKLRQIITKLDGLDVVSNHQPHHYLLNRFFRCRSKKTSKLRVTGFRFDDVIMSECILQNECVLKVIIMIYMGCCYIFY